MGPVLNTSPSRVSVGATRVAPHPEVRPGVVQRAAFIALFALIGWLNQSFAAPQNEQPNSEPLKQLSLAQLGNVEVTTASKEPEKISKTPAAIFVLTQERHSPFRGYQHSGGTASCSGSGGSTNQFQSVVCEHTRTWEWFLEISVGID